MLTRVHKVLIGSAIGLGVVFGAFSAHRENWVMLGATVVLTAGLAFYLRWFMRKTS
jgi:hypothetical protein